ncbi:MAG: DUF4143 domain-containing protein [Patulibacter sp.]
MTAQPAGLSAIMRRAHGTHEGETSDSPSRQTGQRYLDALRRMKIIDEVPAWSPSVRSSKRLTATPKRLLADPALAAALLRISADGLLADIETAGFLFEALVAHDLRVYAEASGAHLVPLGLIGP